MNRKLDRIKANENFIFRKFLLKFKNGICANILNIRIAMQMPINGSKCEAEVGKISPTIIAHNKALR